MLLPFFERTWSGATDIATIFGASGATIFPVSPAPVALWREFAKDQGWVAGYIQLSPTLDLSSLAVDHELGTSNAVFLLDLRPTDWLRSASDTIRQKIRKVSRCATLVEDRSLAAESLKRLYPASIQRLRARPHYHFATETLETWALDPESTVVAASIGESVQAVSLFLSYQLQDVIHALLKRTVLASERGENRLESSDGKDSYVLTIGSDSLPVDLVYGINDGNAPIQVRYSNYLNLNSGRYPGRIAIGRSNNAAVWIFTVNSVRSRLARGQ